MRVSIHRLTVAKLAMPSIASPSPIRTPAGKNGRRATSKPASPGAHLWREHTHRKFRELQCPWGTMARARLQREPPGDSATELRQAPQCGAGHSAGGNRRSSRTVANLLESSYRCGGSLGAAIRRDCFPLLEARLGSRVMGPSSSSRLPDDQVKISGRTSYYENHLAESEGVRKGLPATQGDV